MASVTAPAGSMTQTARGGVSLATRSEALEAPVMPSATNSATVFSDLAKTTQSWPARESRRAILPPIRPRPITPSCIADASFDRD
jgi:hypothetical protein